MKKVHFIPYTRKNGHNEFNEWLKELPSKDSKYISDKIKFIEIQGLQVAQKIKLIKKLDKNLYEIRIKSNNTARRIIYFHIVNNKYIITHGFTKKTQKTPKKELNHALKIRKEYFNDSNYF